MNDSTASQALAAFVQTMAERMTTLARTLGSWVQAEARSLQEQEEQVVCQLHQLGTTLLAGLLTLTPQEAARTLPCSCGAQATYCRRRPATVTTLLGRVSYTRATYSCATCHQGQAPLDQQLQVVAGSLSLGRQELLALLGATQSSFPEAAAVLERLCLVQVCPNTVRAASEELGQSWSSTCRRQPALRRSQEGWTPRRRPCLLGCMSVWMGCWCIVAAAAGARSRPAVFTPLVPVARAALPTRNTLRMEQPSYGATRAEAEAFGWQLYVEARRRGVVEADEVIVIGDGAHWIWKLAEQLFPGATQIVDWYHASQYVWNAATALHGDGTSTRSEWAQQQLDALWEGRVGDVLLSLQAHAQLGGAVEEALSYYPSHRSRMDYPAYRARELQMGSGTIESCCKHLVSARLKQAGMIWSEAGANAVGAVRAWLKSGRWSEAMALRPQPRRGYRRQRTGLAATAEVPVVEASDTVGEVPVQRQASGLPSEVLARVRAEMAQEQTTHPWRKAWSRRQQRAQHAQKVAR